MSPCSNFTYDINKYFVLNTAYIFTGKSLKYLVAIINSKVLDYYFPMISTDVQGQTRRYIKQYVENLPVPQISSEKQLPFTILVDYILFCKSSSNPDLDSCSTLLESVIDGLVYDLYFPEEIKAANAEVLKHLTKLPELKDDWSDEKKMKTIEKVYKELSDPKHLLARDGRMPSEARMPQARPVAIAMERQKTVQEVRIIEGLPPLDEESAKS